MTLLLVMLHTGTMVAVIVYFWRQWRSAYFQSMAAFKDAAKDIVAASALTAVIGGALIEIIEKTAFHGAKGAQVEDLFSHLEIIAPALALGGLLILAAAIFSNRSPAGGSKESPRMSLSQAAWIGAVQGLCLPFRGFSRSGATISTGMLTGVGRREAEAFSFALAVVLTPAAIAREAMRLVHVSTADGAGNHLTSTVTLSLLGAVIAFLAGLVALKWLSRWLEGGRWHLFGIYCLAAAAIVFALHLYGY
jgi:undecaprenyl-diphosphatase